MTVQELIEALQKQDPKLEVMFWPETCGCLDECPIKLIEVGVATEWSHSQQQYNERPVLMLKSQE
jgi:hypothetical protein